MPLMFISGDEKNTIAFKENTAIPFIVNGGSLEFLHLMSYISYYNLALLNIF